MMNYPSLNELVQKAGCRYLLVTAVRIEGVDVRNRYLGVSSPKISGLEKAVSSLDAIDHPEKLGTNKPVSMAVDELYHDKLVLNAPKEG